MHRIYKGFPGGASPAVHQAPLSMGFSRQEYWSGLPFPPPGDLLDPGIKAESAAWQVGFLPLGHLGSPLLTYFRCFLQYFIKQNEPLVS